MKIDEILSSAGKYKRRKRLGRGDGSGKGKTSGKGHKGLLARSGAKVRLNYEGGTNPIFQRIPKRGFNNANFRKTFQIVNLGDLDRFEDDARVDNEALFKERLISDVDAPVKVLANGEFNKKLTVVASKFSSAASEKIEKAGGSVEQVS